jgi:hypothetical protein
MGAFLGEFLRNAFDLDPEFPQNRIIVPADLAAARRGFVDTLPAGRREDLRRARKDHFGQERTRSSVARRKWIRSAALQRTTSGAKAKQFRSPRVFTIDVVLHLG